MRITYWLEVQKEIEIDLSAEDISILYRDAYSEDPKALQKEVLYNLNSVASFLRGVSDEIIGDLSDGQKKIISNFLKEQGARFENADAD